MKRHFRLDPVTARDLEIFHADAGTVNLSMQRLAASTSFSVESASSLIPSSGENNAGNQSSATTGSLFWVLNHCKSPFGRRRLREWLLTPLVNIVDIKQRQAVVTWLLAATRDASKAMWVNSVTQVLIGMNEVEKMLASLQHNRISPKRLVALLKCARRFSELPMAFTRPNNNKDNNKTNNNSSKRSREGSASGRNDSDEEDVFPDSLSQLMRQCAAAQVLRLAGQRLSHLSAAAAEEDDISNVFLESVINASYPDLHRLRVEIREVEVRLQEELIVIRKTLRMPELEYKSLKAGATGALEHLIEVSNSLTANVPKSWDHVNSTKYFTRYHPPEVLSLQVVGQCHSYSGYFLS